MWFTKLTPGCGIVAVKRVTDEVRQICDSISNADGWRFDFEKLSHESGVELFLCNGRWKLFKPSVYLSDVDSNAVEYAVLKMAAKLAGKKVT